ncbi:MAG: tetratricopeptide repeat protein [Candidatus Neomarinimicrobiota bacterium]
MPRHLILAVILISLFGLSCRENPERHLKLGNWYYQKGLVDDAILEYREAIRLHPSNPGDLTRDELITLMKAHYNLAIAYSKKGWYEYALKEAERTFDMWPSKENHEMVELLKKRRSLERLEIEASS